MLCLLGVMLSVLCLVSPAALPTRRACPASSLFKETIEALGKLSSQDSSRIAPLKNRMEAGGNAATYLEGFIEALKTSKNSGEQTPIVKNLQKIQAYAESCTGWKSALKEHHWKAVDECDFFCNLIYLLRFLGHNALPDETS